MLKGLSLHKLHCIKITAPGSAQVEDRGNIGMTDARRCTGFTQKAKPCRFIPEISFTDDFQSHRAVQIDIERLVSDPHRATTQLEQFPVFTRHQLEVLKSFQWLVRWRLKYIPRRRLAGFNPASKSLAKHADRTEFHSSRKLIAAARAGALGLWRTMVAFHKISVFHPIITRQSSLGTKFLKLASSRAFVDR